MCLHAQSSSTVVQGLVYPSKRTAKGTRRLPSRRSIALDSAVLIYVIHVIHVVGAANNLLATCVLTAWICVRC